MFERGNRTRGFPAGVDHVLGQCADDAVTPGIDFADPVTVLAGRLNYAAGAGINYRGDAARLRIKSIFLSGHSVFLSVSQWC